MPCNSLLWGLDQEVQTLVETLSQDPPTGKCVCEEGYKQVPCRAVLRADVAKTPSSQCRGPGGSISSRGTRSHVLQLRVCPPQLKDPACCNEGGNPVCRPINKLFPKHQRHFKCPSARGGQKNDGTSRHWKSWARKKGRESSLQRRGTRSKILVNEPQPSNCPCFSELDTDYGEKKNHSSTNNAIHFIHIQHLINDGCQWNAGEKLWKDTQLTAYQVLR